MNPKPSISFADQLSLLERRKLIIRDRDFALNYLQNNSYYHLNIYFKQKQRETGFVDSLGNKEYEFLTGTTFEDIVAIHENDCRLRNFIQQLLQPIEIRLRTIISYHLGVKAGATVFYDDQPYYDKIGIQRLRSQFAQNIKYDSSNPIVQHHLLKYGGKFPLYAVLELTSFSFLKSFFNCLTFSYQDKIANYFNQKNSKSLKSWLFCLSDLRNLSAHHNYLHQRLFDATPRFIDTSILEQGQNKTLFAYFVVMGYLSPVESWKRVVNELDIYNHETNCLKLRSYGFGTHWKEKLLNDVPHF